MYRDVYGERQERAIAVILVIALMILAANESGKDEQPTTYISQPTATPTLTATPEYLATVTAQETVITQQQATLESMKRSGIIVPVATGTPSSKQYSHNSE